MKSRGLLFSLTALIAVFIIAGCSSTPKKVQEEVTGIKTRVDTLESRVEGVETKQADVEKTTAEQAAALEELKSSKTAMARSNISVLQREGAPTNSVRDIQTALKNAGFYSGKIDGVKGKATRKAIREFQSANGLKADGVVGPKTRELLSKYESSAAAPAAPAAEEGAGTK